MGLTVAKSRLATTIGPEIQSLARALLLDSHKPKVLGETRLLLPCSRGTCLLPSRHARHGARVFHITTCLSPSSLSA